MDTGIKHVDSQDTYRPTYWNNQLIDNNGGS